MTPLNWPSGTLRTLSLIALSSLVGTLLATDGPVPPIVGAASLLVLGYYVGFRTADSGSSPFRLPAGSIRFVLTGLAAFLAFRRWEKGALFDFEDATGAIFFMVLAFLAGNAWRASMRVLLRGGGGPLASFGNHAKGVALIASLTALILLAVLGEDTFERFTPDQVRAVLVAVIAFYFGSRTSG